LRAITREKLEIVFSASAFWRGGRKGGSGGIPPAEPVNKIGSDFFKYAPPTKKEVAGSPSARANQPIASAKLNFCLCFAK